MTSVSEAIRRLVIEFSFLGNEFYQDLSPALKEALYEYMSQKIYQQLATKANLFRTSLENKVRTLQQKGISVNHLTPENRFAAEEFLQEATEFLDVYESLNILSENVSEIFLENLDPVNNLAHRRLIMQIVEIYFHSGIPIPIFLQEYIFQQF